MESHGFFKSGKITLLGFILFSLIVIWTVNAYYLEERNFEKQELDIQKGKEIMSDLNELNSIFLNMQVNLHTQKEWLENNISEDSEKNEGEFLNQILYLSAQNVSILDENQINKPESIGNVIVYGDASTAEGSLKKELNALEDFFLLEQILNQRLDFEMKNIYYSRNKYVTYYPYVSLGTGNVNYNQIFNNVDRLMTQVQSLKDTLADFNPESVWNTVSRDENNSERVYFSSSLPVVVEDEIQGILTGQMNQEVFGKVLKKQSNDFDIYLVDKNDNLIYTNREEIHLPRNIADVFGELYSVKYYQNTFPTVLEIRNDEDYSFYIGSLSNSNGYIIYAVNKENARVNLKAILINAMLITMVSIIVYWSIRSSNSRKDNIEVLIKNSQNDGLTGLLNHQYILEALTKFLKNRRIKKLALIMIDIDDFKEVNDTYGHTTGDQVLKICADVIKRLMDVERCVCGRYGGDEFLLLAIKHEEGEARSLAEEIRIKVNERIYDEMGISVTVSIGVHPIMKPTILTDVELIDKVDENLYAAKTLGKNQVG